MRIAELYERSWFADLAYVSWRPEAIGETGRLDAIRDANAALRAPELTLPPVIPGDLGETVGPALATQIFDPDAEAWSVRHHQPNTSSGYSATLFAQAGSARQMLAIRGTETMLGQIDPDLLQTGLQEIGGLGMALSQTVSLFNHVRALQAPAGAAVIELTLHTAAAVPAEVSRAVSGDGEVFWVTAAASGTGLGLLDPGVAIDVTGHSLGGHLAALAIRLFPAQFGQAVTFNAPGFDAMLGVTDSATLLTGLATTLGSGGTSAVLQILTAIVQNGQQLTTDFVDELFAPYLSDAPPVDFIDLAGHGRIVSLVSEDQAPGDDFAAVSQLWLTGIPASPRVALTVEINSHAMSGMVDALAVQALLERIDPAITLAAAGKMLALASNRGGNSEEQLVDRLTRLFLGADWPLLGEAAADGLTQWIATPEPYYNRGVLHQRIIEIEQALAAHDGLSIAPLSDFAAADLAGLAAAHIAYRYALVALNPFVVLGDDTLYAGHAATLDPVTLSERYLEDRAQFVVGLVARNADDQAVAIAGPEQLEFIDVASAERVVFRSELNWPRRQTLFGTPGDDGLAILAGGDSTIDHVYGGAGDDILAGYARDDYLEGNDGDDELRGGTGQDVLHGNDGDDRLYGNELDNVDDDAADGLHGGSGYDRYYVGDGDVIVDSDGQGEILVGAAQTSLSGTYRQVADGIYRNADLNAALYVQANAATLVAFGFPTPIRVRITAPTGWNAGDLGIVLDDGSSADGPRLTGTAAAERLDAGTALIGTDGDDYIDALAGDDDLFGGRGFGQWGQDVLIGGPGDDYLDSATVLDLGRADGSADDPGDILDAGPGRDVAVGNGGDDIVLGGLGDDFLSGRGGRDLIDGGAGDDVLAGGAGVDTLFGGPGDDHLFGDFEVWATPARTWSVTPVFDGGGRLIDVGLSDVYLGDNPPAAAADTLFGGDGDDFLNGGNGNDRLYGEDGVDVLFGWRGDDALDGGADDDALYGDSFGLLAAEFDGHDTLLGGTGNDALWGEGGNDWLEGGAGDDSLDGGPGDDVLDGGPGDDRLDGGAGHDVFYAGPGQDRVQGGAGNDRFVYRAGDGHDVIADSGGYDLVIVEGVADLETVSRRFDADDLVFEFDVDNSLTLVDWGRGGVDEVRADRDVLHSGGPLDPGLVGKLEFVAADHDRAAASAGNVFVIEADAVHVQGGSGHDRYVVGATVTTLSIDDAGGVDVIELPDGIGVADVSVEARGPRFALVAGRLSIDFDGQAIERLVFADGDALGVDWFATWLPQAPRVEQPLPDASAIAGRPFSYTVPAGSFVDTNPGDTLSLSASLADGSGLPRWLAFAPESGAFSGTAPLLAKGLSYAVTVSATDAGGMVAIDNLYIDVLGAPVGAEVAAIVRVEDLELGNGLLSTATLNALRDPDATPRIDFFDGIGDVNGDSVDDLIHFTADDEVGTGARIEVVFGHAGSFGAVLEETAFDGRNGFVITGADAYVPLALFGHSHEPATFGARGVLRGDVDGDGLDDVVLPPTASWLRPDGDPGSARVILGRLGDFPASLSWAALPTTAEIAALVPQDGLAAGYFPVLTYTGLALVDTGVDAGDINGDGLRDRVYARPTGDAEQAVAVVVFGASAPLTEPLALEALDGAHGFRIAQHFAALTDGIGQFGTQVQSLGDVNGDGFDDLGIGSETYSVGSAEHYVAVVFGKPGGYGGVLDLAQLDGSNGYLASVQGSPGTLYGHYVRAAGDIDDDGFADVIVSSGRTQSSHVIFGATARDLPVTVGTPGADLLLITAAGEFHAGGGDDDVTLLASGTVYLHTGSGRDTVHFGTTDTALPTSFAPGTTFHVSGGSGADLYIVAGIAGSLRIRISDPVTAAEHSGPDHAGNHLLFGAGYDPHTFVLRRGSLLLDFGAGMPTVHLDSFDPDDVLGGPRDIERFEFADGTVLDYASLVARGFAIDGGSGDDRLRGTNLVDRIVAGPGNDILDGGAGNDVLDGGFGDDTYVLGLGDGTDRVQDSGGFDQVLWSEGIELADLAFAAVGADLAVTVAGGDVVTFTDWFSAADHRIERFAFADGTMVDPAGLVPDNPLPPFAGLVLRGTPRKDVLRGGPGPDRVSGRAGHDDIATFAGADQIDGGPGRDHIRGGAGNDSIRGGPGNDVIHGNAGNDWLSGGPGNDILVAGPGHDTVLGGTGRDVLRAGAGRNRLAGGSGNDRYEIAAGRGSHVILDTGGTRDQLRFDRPGLGPGDLSYRRRGKDLVIGLPDKRNAVTIERWYAHPRHRIEHIGFADGTTLTPGGVDRLVQAMAAFNGASMAEAALPRGFEPVFDAVLAMALQAA